jgi:hypothetical protein
MTCLILWNYKLANPKKDGKHGFIMDLALFLKWECPFLSFFYGGVQGGAPQL